MRLRLDYQGKVPIYLQIADQVKQAVASGDLPPGVQLPTVREVATELRVNFNTVARAYRLLHEEGVISTQQGRGTYVLPVPAVPWRSREQLLAELVDGWLTEAGRLGYTAAEVGEAIRERAASHGDDGGGNAGARGPTDR